MVLLKVSGCDFLGFFLLEIKPRSSQSYESGIHLRHQETFDKLFDSSYGSFLFGGIAWIESQLMCLISPCIYFFYRCLPQCYLSCLSNVPVSVPTHLVCPDSISSTCWSEANTQVTFNTQPGPCLGERRAWHNKGCRTGSPVHIYLLLLENTKKLD